MRLTDRKWAIKVKFQHTVELHIRRFKSLYRNKVFYGKIQQVINLSFIFSPELEVGKVQVCQKN